MPIRRVSDVSLCVYMFICVYLYFYCVSLCVRRSEDDEVEQRKVEEVRIIRGERRQ
jgi:hypothetical protein